MRLNQQLEWLIQVILGACVVALPAFMMMEINVRPATEATTLASVATPEIPSGPAPSPRSLPPVREYAAMLERPLFSPTRAPGSATPAQTTNGVAQKIGAPADAPEMILSAVLINKGQRLAILESARGKDLHKTSVGEIVNGWTLVAIDPEAVSLRKGSEVKRLELRIQGSPEPGKKPRQEPPKSAKSSETGKGEASPTTAKKAENQSD
jgi:hypothetical protein